MSKIALFLTILFLSGCAKIWVREDMQPDKSYKVTANGNGPASFKNTKAAAYEHAALLCPSGYDKKAEIPYDNFKPAFSLVVMCK